jgi:predicted dehydrogenase
LKDEVMKIGMVGAGYILKSHATAVMAIDGAKLHAVADVSIGRARQAAQTYGFEHALGSIEEMARTDCDIVHILLPPFLHIAAAETLIDAGKSVFLEKPMGLSSGECAGLCDRADERGVRIGVNHNFLFLPGYEALRSAVRAGELGRIDALSVNWHWGLPQLQHGPFDTWMLAAPANLMFELGAHLGAFLVDLAGPVAVKAAVAGHPLMLPTGRQAFRHWSMIGEADRAAVTLSLSTVPGQPDQYVRVRGSGGSAQLDFARDIGWREVTTHDNPILNAHAGAASIARQTSRQARADRKRRIIAALRKSPEAAAFDESIFRSVRAFYEAGAGVVDDRHSGPLRH